MNMALWAVQVALALVFGLSGGMKTFMTIEALSEMLAWINHVPGWVPRLAGISELLAMAGLLLPSITRVRPKLTPIAASGMDARLFNREVGEERHERTTNHMHARRLGAGIVGARQQ